MIRFITAHKTAFAVIIVIGIGALGFAFFGRSQSKEETVIVTRGEIIVETLLTGVVKSARSAELSFDRAGVLSSLPASVSKSVNHGAILAMLKNETENAAVAEARAAQKVAQARLAEVLRGARIEEIRVKEAAKAEKETAFQSQTEKSAALIADAYSASDEALNRYADPLFSNDESTAPQLLFSSGNQSGMFETELRRVSAGALLKALRARVLGYSDSAEAALAATLENLRGILGLFLSLDAVLSDGSGISASTLADYKENVATGRNKIVSSIIATQNHLNALRESESALLKAKSELALSQAGPTAEALREAEEELVQADAQLRSAEAVFEKTVLRAPFEGRITSRRVIAGETISSGEIITTVEGASGFMIEAEVPEADIAKIRVGDTATITLDAYGSAVLFPSRITEIEQSEKVIEGVSTYKTTLVFLENDPRLRSGMTANITIVTEQKTGVLFIPLRIVQKNNGKDTVLVLRNDGTKEIREITVGLRGSNGLVEIKTGLAEGEKVLALSEK